MGIEVSHLEVAQLQVVEEVLPDETAAAFQGLAVEVCVQALSLKAPEREVQQDIVLRAQLLPDIGEDAGGVERPVPVLAIMQSRKIGDDLFVVVHSLSEK